MSDYDSNYNSICCPFCGEKIFDNKYCLGTICLERGISDLEDEEEDFFECIECGISFKVELRIYKEYDYIISKPTKEEVEIWDLKIGDEKIIKDCPGQIFMWDSLTDKG